MRLPLLSALITLAPMTPSHSQDPPVRIGVAGLEHGHVDWILSDKNRPDFTIVGLAEADEALARAKCERYHIDPALVHPSLEAMLEAAKPEAVVVFTSIDQHLDAVRACAARGIHVMVEKPLALDAEQARAIAALAEKHGIHVLTNYETTWYPSVQATRRVVQDGAVGDIRKMIARDGHQGPKELGAGEEFLAWLTDPDRNGGGAIIDFGCYGANLMTWLMDNERPESVLAVTQQLKTNPLYARVDDEATILLVYPKAQGIIQASWNWPYSRKDLDVYGTKGAVFADDRTRLRQRHGESEKTSQLPPAEAPYNDPFAYLAAVVRGKADPEGSLSSLENNVIVMEILDAARASAKSGRAVPLKPAR
ncbi:MAG: Gfo/Idh/MocA family oxidoreductase [Chthoniobacterales bacterium]|nr:Gfo/Idh/MocA family oxidoreductase [Chthoniobacterales bacterium]